MKFKIALFILGLLLCSCGNKPTPPAPEEPVINDILVFDAVDSSSKTNLVIYNYQFEKENYDTFRIEEEEDPVVSGYRAYINGDRFNFSLAIKETESSNLINAVINSNGDLTLTFDEVLYTAPKGVWEDALYTDKSYSLQIDHFKVKKTYNIGEQISLDGLSVYLYSYSNKVKELASGEYYVEGFDSSSAGFKYIDIRYGNIHGYFEVTVIGYVYHLYNDKEVYYLNEEFDKSQFELFYYDETGEKEVLDYEVTLPKVSSPQISYFEITHNNFQLNKTIYVMNKPDNAPLKFSSSSNNSLTLYQSNIRTIKVNNIEHTYSDGYYLYQYDGMARIYSMSFELSKESWVSSFSSSLPHRITSKGNLEVKVEKDTFVALKSDWHLSVIGWTE